MNKIAGSCIPQFACSIIASRNKLVSIFIKTTVGQRQNMALQFFNQFELLLSFFLNFLDQFYNSMKIVILLMMALICDRFD